MKAVTGLLLGAGLLLSSGMAQAAWPEKPITLVVPYAPGGYTDSVGRITGRFLEAELGQTVVIENRAGGGGIVGSDLVSKSKPDGYTLCMCSVGAISVAPIAQKTEYNPVKSFSAISIVSTIPQTVIVNPSLPIKSMDELVSYAREHPGELNFGSSGAGGLMFYSVALFQSLTGTEMTHVPFGGGAPATAAVVAGEVDLSFTNMTDALPQMEAKTVRALAVTSTERSPFAPDLPTVSETVSEGYSVESWNAVMAPAGIPDEAMQKLSAALQKMAQDKEVIDAMAKIGAQTVFTEPKAFSERIAREVNQWKKLLTEIGIKQ